MTLKFEGDFEVCVGRDGLVRPRMGPRQEVAIPPPPPIFQHERMRCGSDSSASQRFSVRRIWMLKSSRGVPAIRFESGARWRF